MGASPLRMSRVCYDIAGKSVVAVKECRRDAVQGPVVLIGVGDYGASGSHRACARPFCGLFESKLKNITLVLE